jgi:hypothetical protein
MFINAVRRGLWRFVCMAEDLSSFKVEVAAMAAVLAVQNTVDHKKGLCPLQLRPKLEI